MTLLGGGARVASAQAADVAAQKQIAVRPLGPSLAASRDTLGARIVVRALADGRVLVGTYGAGETTK